MKKNPKSSEESEEELIEKRIWIWKESEEELIDFMNYSSESVPEEEGLIRNNPKKTKYSFW